MLHFISGTPGSGKTLYGVSIIKKMEDDNKLNIMLNPPSFIANKKVIDEFNLHQYFDCYQNKDDSFTAVAADFYDCLGIYHRQDDYFFRSVMYNKSLDWIIKDFPELKRRFKYMRPVRTIYANISGLKVDHVRDAPEDWRLTPFGSVIFYDEIQLLASYAETRNGNPIVDALSIHRHTGHDIYGISQFPIQVHQKFRAVTGQHFHIVRGWGLPSAAVYVWGYAVTSPNSPIKKLFAERKIRFNYPTVLYEYYNSSMIHTHKMRIPPKMIAIAAFVCVMAFISFNMLFMKDNFLNKLFTGRAGEHEQAAQIKPANANQQINQSGQANIGTLGTVQNQLEASVSHAKYLGQEMAAFIADEDIRPAMIVSSDLTCKAYNTKGERLLIDNTLCLMMSKDTSLIPRSRKEQINQLQQPAQITNQVPVTNTGA